MALAEGIAKDLLKKLLKKVGVSAAYIAWPLAVKDAFDTYKTLKNFYDETYKPATREAKKWSDITAKLESTQAVYEKSIEAYSLAQDGTTPGEFGLSLSKDLEGTIKDIRGTNYEKREELAARVEGVYKTMVSGDITLYKPEIFSSAVEESRNNLINLTESLEVLESKKKDAEKKFGSKAVITGVLTAVNAIILIYKKKKIPIPK